MKWQPIETAPLDDRILTYDNGFVTISTFDKVHPPYFAGKEYVWRDDSDRDFGGHQEPSHWMPLPEPPLV